MRSGESAASTVSARVRGGCKYGFQGDTSESRSQKQKWNKFRFSLQDNNLDALAILEQNGYMFSTPPDCWLH
jgi:hypothetical protein